MGAANASLPRRAVLGGGAAFALALGSDALARTPAMGSDSAQVTLTEYGSLTCGHCAAFHREVLPAIKARFIDTGQVRYVFKAFPTAPVNLSASLHALADCVGPSNRYSAIEAFMAEQQVIFESARNGSAKAAAYAIARRASALSDDQLDACLADRSRLQTILSERDEGIAAGVTATPTVFINGVKLEEGAQGYTVALLSAALSAAVARTRRAPQVQRVRP